MPNSTCTTKPTFNKLMPPRRVHLIAPDAEEHGQPHDDAPHSTASGTPHLYDAEVTGEEDSELSDSDDSWENDECLIAWKEEELIDNI